MSTELRTRLQLYLVMGSANCPLAQPEEVLEAALRGGITMFQYREKGDRALQGDDKLQLGHRLKRLCHEYGVPFIVNDDIELALTLEADGLHIGQEDGAVPEIRRRLGESMLLGVSAHNPQEAMEAVRQGADYLGVGPMYLTTTKPDIAEVQGPSVIRDIRSSLLDVPIVGIGGITASNAAPVLEAGADGIAVVSAITASSTPYQATVLLKQTVEAQTPHAAN